MGPPREGAGRADLAFGLGWAALGVAVTVASWRMDRLEGQGVEPYAVPGLLPGLLGVLLAVLGLALALRGWRGPRGPRGPEGPAGEAPVPQATPAEAWRVALALALCVGFAAGALGRGPPFWLAAFAFVFLSILLFEWPERRREGTLARGAAQAFAIAAVGSAAVTFVFQEVFLVRLP